MLTQEWMGALASSSSRKVMAVTLLFGANANDVRSVQHVGEYSDAVRCATHPHVDIPDLAGRQRPYWQDLLAWPDIERAWSPERRIAETATTRLQVSAAALPRWTDGVEGEIAGYADISLWSDRIKLGSMVPLMSGPFTMDARSGRSGASTITVTDGDLRRHEQASPGKITSDEFPDAPLAVVNAVDRQLVLGGYPAALPLIQIDKAGLVFYVHDYAATEPPTLVSIGPARVMQPFRVRVRRMARTGTPYTCIEFLESPWQSAALGVLTCTGGVGLAPASPVIALLEDFGGYVLTERARAALRSISIRQDVLVRSPADIFNLVNARLMPQTTAVLAWERGKIDVLDFRRPAGEFHMTKGIQLRDRLPGQNVSVTDEANIYNAVEIDYGRDAASGGTTGRLTIGAESGGRIGRLAEVSEAKWGHRALGISGERAWRDISSEGDARMVGEFLIELLANQHSVRPYPMEWLPGMMLSLNSSVPLTDADEGLSEKATRVVRHKVAATGPQVVFQTVDGDGVDA